MSNKLPLVIILGATGSGKTKLSLELARKFGGEIIGADSMQVYKELDIITAKATREERSLAPHHLIDILGPKETFTVIEYRNRALQIVRDIMGKNKVPIVVGGTNYYIESLLWKILIENDINNPKALPNHYHELPSEELHTKLKLLDPSMARRLHPNNKRKIIRALEVLYQKGRKLSEILEEQQSAKDGSRCDGGLRFTNSLVLWLQCNQEVLNERLNDRVDSMMKQGLLKELLNFHELYNEDRLCGEQSPDYTKGIFQCIGFKEFHSYLVLNDGDRASEAGQKILQEGTEQLKLVTRRYARKQKSWIVNRFLGRSDRRVPPIYGLDTTDASQWDEKISKPAEEIVESYISGHSCERKPLPKVAGNSTSNSEEYTYNCDVCNRVFIGSRQWEIHMKSNKHRRRLEKVQEAKGD